MSLHWNLSNSPPGLDDHNMMTQMMMTTFLYTYIGPEERMQKQRKDNISSPAVRDNIKMAPTSSPRLSWTRRQVSAPAPAERREAARVPQEAAATRARRTSGRLPLPLTSCALGESYTVLAAPSRSTSPPTFSRAGESRRTRSRSSPASCQKPPSLQPGPPSVVLCALTATQKYEAQCNMRYQNPVYNRQVSANKSQSGSAHPSTHTRHPSRGRRQQQGGENPMICK